MDLLALARKLERDLFIAECPFPVLLAVNEPIPASSQELFSDEFVTISSLKQPQQAPQVQPVTQPVLYAVQKVHPLIPQGIVLGRTNECDIVVRDLSVSKAHALFQEAGGNWSISDLGSRNGTHVKNTRAQPRGEALAVHFGDIVSFAFRTFYFLDSGAAWDRVRAVDAPRAKRERTDPTPA